MGSMAGKPLIGLGFTCQNGAVSNFEGGVQLTSSDRQDHFQPFGSLFHPDWRESEAQLTEKQAVLLMHDTLPQGIKSIRALLHKESTIA